MLFQYACWNIQGKCITQCLDSLLSSELDFHILGLQEVSLDAALAKDEQRGTPGVTFHNGYTILHGWPAGCFRRLALCVEDGILQKWCRIKCGHSHLVVQVQLSICTVPVTVVVLHLPHSGRPLSDFHMACLDLQRDLQRSLQQKLPVMVLGDFNEQIHVDTSVNERWSILQNVLTGLDLLHFSSDGLPTWRNRRIDHILFNSTMVHLCSPIGPADCPCSLLQVRPDFMSVLGVDHALLLGESLLRNCPSHCFSQTSRRRRRALQFQQRPCRMVLTEADPIQAFIYRHSGLTQFSPGQIYSSLKDLVPVCSKPLPSRKYMDPPHIKELCRVRSLCTTIPERKHLSVQIFQLRKLARQQWHRTIVREAACGNWACRKLLHPRRPLAAATRPLIDRHDGDPSAAAASVRQHFQNKFSSDSAPVPHDFLHGLPDEEPPWTLQEVGDAVAALKTNKTTGISRINVAMLKSLVEATFGLELLTELLNAFLADPASLPNDLAEGWVILLPKRALVDQPDQFRPIVCGEVLLKILSKLAVARIVSQWPVPQCCFGACRGRGVPEALYTVKACSQELGGMQDDTVFLQLDISSAFDSLQHRAILTFLRDHWCASTAKSSKIIHWILSHSVLKFQLFDTDWQVQQQVGTQQGASHSPVLFGRLVAAHFDKLCRGWGLAGELPAFFAGQYPLWGIWYIDDAICFFRNAAQFARLVPSLVQCLAGLGLNVNIAKSCTLSCFGSPRAIPCLPGLPHVTQSTYLGLKLLLEEGDEHMLQGYLRRTSAAFFSNRVLLINPHAPRHARLRLFQALVTSTILWSLAVLPPSAHHVCALRVQHVTLTGWMLRCAPHLSWQDPQTIPVARHAVKIWLRSYSKLWDHLLLEQQWKWLGHILRLPRDDILRQTLLNLRPTSRAFGHRRSRTGPNNSGHRLALRWLRHEGVDPSLAHDRHAWDSLGLNWLLRFGIRPPAQHVNVFHTHPAASLPTDFRAIQGCFRGQQVLVLSVPSPDRWLACELDRTEGWRCLHIDALTAFAGFCSVLTHCVFQWCRAHTFHCRVLLMPSEGVHFQFVWANLPCLLQVCKAKTLVCEISLLPNAWLTRMKPEIAYLARSG